MMNKKIYHQRGRKPSGPVRKLPEGRIYKEHVDDIVRMYTVDRMNVRDIARQYKVHENNIGRICRRGQRYKDGQGTQADDRYFSSTGRYNMALKLMEEHPGCNIWIVHKITGLRTREIRLIAARNGIAVAARQEGK